MVSVQDSLTDKERQLLATRSDVGYERAVAVGMVARLAGVLQDPAIAIERVRLSDVDTSRAMAVAAKALLDVLDPALPRAERVVPVITVDRQRPTRRISEVVRDEAFPAAGLKFLRTFVDDPYDDLTSDHIPIVADEIAKFDPTHRKHAIDRRELLVHRLNGVKPSTIADMYQSRPATISHIFAELRAAVQSQPDPRKLVTDISERITSMSDDVKLTVETVPLTDEVHQEPEKVVRPEVAPTTQRTVVVERKLPGSSTAPAIERGREPRHVELTDLITAYVELEGSQRAALQSFLDPRSAGDMTPRKEEVVEKLRAYIRKGIERPMVELSAVEAEQVRKVFGVYGSPTNPRDAKPVPLVDLLKPILQQTQRNATAENVFNGLDKIFMPVQAA